MKTLFLTLAVAALTATTGICAPFVPATDGTVIERLPESRDPAMAAMKKLRAAQRRAPGDLALATAYARRAIEAARASGDPRPLGHAQAALGPWWNGDDVPRDALLLRATIKQSLHDFDASLRDLDRLVARAPDDAQALLTRATVRSVVGRHDEARADCDRLESRVAPLIAAACRASAEGATGGAARAGEALARALDADRGSPTAVRVWALTLAGEIAARAGDAVAAESRYREAFARDPADAYLIGAYADLLLDEGRPAEAIRLLEPHARHDALLLRLVIAGMKVPARGASNAEERAELAARIDAARRRGDTVHRREEARYALIVEGDAARAVALARANFAVQKEPADVRLLIDAARATGDASALALAREWIGRTGWVDVRAATGAVRA